MLSLERKNLIYSALKEKHNHSKAYYLLGYFMVEYWDVLTDPNKPDDELYKWVQDKET